MVAYKFFMCWSGIQMLISFLFLIFYLFLEGKGGREGEKHQCVVASCAPPTGELTCNPGICSDWESNRPPFGLLAGPQSTEPHEPGLISFLKALQLRDDHLDLAYTQFYASV